MELALRNKLRKILKVTARGFEKSVSRKKTSLASYGYSNIEGKFCKLQVLSRAITLGFIPPTVH